MTQFNMQTLPKSAKQKERRVGRLDSAYLLCGQHRTLSPFAAVPALFGDGRVKHRLAAPCTTLAFFSSAATCVFFGLRCINLHTVYRKACLRWHGTVLRYLVLRKIFIHAFL